MPHLSPMNWLILLIFSWFFLMTLMTQLFFSSSLPFSVPNLAPKITISKLWPWT